MKHLKLFENFKNESIDNSRNKMKNIVNNLLSKEIGGRDYFNAIDSSIKLTKNIDLIQDVFNIIRKENKNFNLILTGGFGEWVLNMIKKGKLSVPKNLVLVNGSIRGKKNKLNKITTGDNVDIIFKKDNIENQDFILFDDSYYSGSTKKAIDKYLKKFNSEIKQTFVLYDGNDKIDNNRKSLYRYYNYNNGTSLPVNKLLNYLYNINDIPIDDIENKILKGEIKTIRDINSESNKIRLKIGKNQSDINKFTRREESKFEKLIINNLTYLI